MIRGRPVKSHIRQNMVEILFVLGEASGYDIYKVYREVYPKIALRSIYYHLKKGCSINEFKISKIEKEKGNFSWGGEAEKKYYSLGDFAKPVGDEKVKNYIDKNK
ncbi:MAG: hypothetical protein ACMXX8_00400 [Candidatus Woesearchaeota archaeon]